MRVSGDNVRMVGRYCGEGRWLVFARCGPYHGDERRWRWTQRCRIWAPHSDLPMDTTKTALERAFELAETGKFRTNGELKTALAKEGYNAGQVTGPRLLRQLRQIMADARK